eukprot:1176347-Prorocentrum_minimum.AAC.1
MNGTICVSALNVVPINYLQKTKRACETVVVYNCDYDALRRRQRGKRAAAVGRAKLLYNSR